jgi:hypothetical protein
MRREHEDFAQCDVGRLFQREDNRSRNVVDFQNRGEALIEFFGAGSLAIIANLGKSGAVTPGATSMTRRPIPS